VVSGLVGLYVVLLSVWHGMAYGVLNGRLEGLCKGLNTRHVIVVMRIDRQQDKVWGPSRTEDRHTSMNS
jgi:hypothetical protein